MVAVGMVNVSRDIVNAVVALVEKIAVRVSENSSPRPYFPSLHCRQREGEKRGVGKLILLPQLFIFHASFFCESPFFTGICPVLCSGRGEYLNGECQCNPGWKGKECNLRHDECEVPDCNGHGKCVNGKCSCMRGYKGEFCQEGKE